MAVSQENTTQMPAFVQYPQHHQESEWPLLIFTLALMLAIGTYFWGSVWFFFKPEYILICWISFAWSFLGMIASLKHLASPLRAPRSILNWKTSWLSREILLVGAFLGQLTLIIFLHYLNQYFAGFIPPAIPVVVSITTGLTGIVLAAGLTMIYRVPTHPIWNHIDTTLSYVAGVFLMGWSQAAFFLSLWYLNLSGLTLATMAFGMFLLIALRGYLFSTMTQRVRSVPIVYADHNNWHNKSLIRFRYILLGVGGLLPVISLLVSGNLWILWFVASLSIFCGEVLERWIFYQASPAVLFPPRFM
ncbi:MAG: dimethyl sulfoxide reductase anchor subunit family protein [Desulfitobacterium sp.]